MKLLVNYYRTTILATVLVVILSSCAYFFIIHYILVEQLDDSLKEEEQEVIDYIKEKDTLPGASGNKDQQVVFKPAINNEHLRKFSTINFYDKDEKEYITARELAFTIKAQQKNWLVSIIKSQEETEDLVKVILVITVVIVIALSLILFLVNRFILRRLWKPFYSTLAQVKEFNLPGKMRLNLQYSRVDEFNQLNSAVKIMTDRVRDEYNTLKNFTDNASHELQTPLAIINSKLDLLIQDESINEHQMEKLQFIYTALNKMSRINQSLLLLARIENNQFGKTNKVYLDRIINEKLLLFDDLILNKGLTVNKNIQPISLWANADLLDILVSNLISNAIYYGNEKGTITITVSNNELVVSNSSELPPLDKQKLFQRFYRHEETNKEGNGLGLSIIKQICTASGYTIDYYFENGDHKFRIVFNQ